MRPIIGLFGALVLFGTVTGCGDDTVEDDIEERVDQTTARAAAETFRVNIMAEDLDEHDPREMALLEDAGDRIPGSPTIVGLEDTSGDGLDDDGLIEVRVGDESACLMVSEDGGTIDVEGGACP